VARDSGPAQPALHATKKNAGNANNKLQRAFSLWRRASALGFRSPKGLRHFSHIETA